MDGQSTNISSFLFSQRNVATKIDPPINYVSSRISTYSSAYTINVPSVTPVVHSSDIRVSYFSAYLSLSLFLSIPRLKFAKVRKNVLIVSTDPAHNLSDAFGQKFSRTPTLVEGFTNLFCMEIDPTVEVDEGPDLLGGNGSSITGSSMASTMKNFMKDFSANIPGIDELMSFAELMKHVQRMDFDITVFDTAPTGHTLRLLSLPGMIDKGLNKLLSLRSTFSAVLGSMAAFTGNNPEISEEAIIGKLTELKQVIDAVQSRIHSADETTFVCVCIPEFLSLYETERLVQELTKFDIDTHNIVVNQVLFPTPNSNCDRCAARTRMQNKYLDQIGDLYEDFHVVKTPLLNEEIRGPVKLRAFGTYLLEQYDANQLLPPELESSLVTKNGTSSSSSGNK